MIEIKKELFSAFGEDHATLGNGFHILAAQLREGNIATIKLAAHKLDQDAGAHIAFEEFDFYPQLKLSDPTIDIDKMYASHEVGLSVIKNIFELRETSNNSLIAEKFKQEQLLKINRMDNHVAECGELFSIMDNLNPEDIKKLYRGLLEWRGRKPKWTKLSDYKI